MLSSHLSLFLIDGYQRGIRPCLLWDCCPFNAWFSHCAEKKQTSTSSLAVPSTCLAIWPLFIFAPSRFKTGWVILVCPLFFVNQGWWESCPSDYLCTAQELDVLRSAWFTPASPSLHQYHWAAFVFQVSVWNIFFFSLRNIISLKVINARNSAKYTTWLSTTILTDEQLKTNDFKPVPHLLLESVLLCQILVILASGGSSVSDLL